MIRKVIPHIPVSETICISARLSYWEYAGEPDELILSSDITQSTTANAEGKTSRRAHPFKCALPRRSAA